MEAAADSGQRTACIFRETSVSNCLLSDIKDIAERDQPFRRASGPLENLRPQSPVRPRKIARHDQRAVHIWRN